MRVLVTRRWKTAKKPPRHWPRAAIRRCWRRCWSRASTTAAPLDAGRCAGDPGHQRQWRARAGRGARRGATCRFSRWARRPRKKRQRPALPTCASADGDAEALAAGDAALGAARQGRAAACLWRGRRRHAGGSSAPARLHGAPKRSFMRSSRRSLPPEAMAALESGRAGCGAVLFAPQRRHFSRRWLQEALPTESLIGALHQPGHRRGPGAPALSPRSRVASAPNQDSPAGLPGLTQASCRLSTY